MERIISVVGLGYVGMHVATAFSRHYGVIGYDNNEERVRDLARHIDRNLEFSAENLAASEIRFTSDYRSLEEADFHIVAVPTPVDGANRPDLTALAEASEKLGLILKPGDIVVFESTVYPGATEKFCVPILESASGMKNGNDFFVAYSPERVNPGDRSYSLENITKIIAAQNERTLDIVADIYSRVIPAGVVRSTSIITAEAAKLVENIQRDINIALMNELAMVFDGIGINITDVLGLAKTKWNFAPFKPGMVGGHCIGVDTYYFLHKAKESDHDAMLIKTARTINDYFPSFIANKTMRSLASLGIKAHNAKVGILGLAYKENSPDMRSSKSVDLVRELKSRDVETLVHDPLVNALEAKRNHKIDVVSLDEFESIDVLILCVEHDFYKLLPLSNYGKMLKPGHQIFDIKSCLDVTEANSIGLSVVRL